MVVDTTIEYDKLTSPMYLGEHKGKEVAKQYIIQVRFFVQVKLYLTTY